MVFPGANPAAVDQTKGGVDRGTHGGGIEKFVPTHLTHDPHAHTATQSYTLCMPYRGPFIDCLY